MKNRRFLALALSAVLVIGSGVTVFADDASQIVGEGTSFDHVNKEITDVTLPTSAAVEKVFNYYVDPERLINQAGELADTSETVSGNDDGVYFKNTSTSGNDVYTSTSDAVKFEGKNSVDVDVTVTAAVESSEGGKDITLVADEEALNAATDPALLMNLIVGSDKKAITSDGATASATIAGVKGNFEVTVSDNDYVYGATSDAEEWNSTTVQLSGKTNEVNVPDGEKAMTAPTIKLTWTIAKHSEIPARSSAGDIVVPASGGATVAITVGLDGAVPTSLTTTYFSGNLFTATNKWCASYDSDTNTITFGDGEKSITNDFRTQNADALGATYTVTFTTEDGTTYTQNLTFAQ